MLIAVFVLLGATATWAVWIFNRLTRDRNRTRAGWSDIDVQLQRRHDLIPRLVETVRGYAGYERATLTAVTELRAASRAAQAPAEKARIEERLEAGARRLLAVAESYPELKADRNFLELQKQLTEIEDHLQHARRFYNGAVRQYNTRVESFPDLLVARVFRFGEADFFGAAEDARSPVQVRLDGRGASE